MSKSISMLPALYTDNDGRVPDERLSKAHLIVLEHLRVRGPSTAQQVGDACYGQTRYDKEGLVGNQAGIRKRWANRVLRSLHHAARAHCSHEGAWALYDEECFNEPCELSHNEQVKIITEIKLLLHASRDCMRTRGLDTTTTTFAVQDGYYGEAFGILRALACLGYGSLVPIRRTYGPVPISQRKDLKKWFHEIEEQVLSEEHFRGDNKCQFCLERYGKDGAGRTRHLLECNSVKQGCGPERHLGLPVSSYAVPIECVDEDTYEDDK